MKCDFFVKVYAPEGLLNISSHLDECRLKLSASESGYNGKVILKNAHSEELEWNMDSSDDEYLVATGSIYGDIERAKLLLGDFGIALTAGGYPHEICLDDENGNLKEKSSFMWVGQHDS